jgi:hypothetical protein
MSTTTKDSKKSKETLFSKYMNLMDNYPLVMNTIQGTLIAACSVIVSQYIICKEKSNFVVDTWEVNVMSSIQLAFIAPVLFFYCGNILPLVPFGNAGQLIADQFIFSPIFTSAIVALRLYFYDGKIMNEIPDVLVKIMPSTMSYCWLFWIPVRLYAIVYIPLKYHLLYAAIMSFFWNIIFSLVLSS